MSGKPTCVYPLFCFYVILFSVTVSGFAPVTYNSEQSTECMYNNSWQNEQMMESIKQIEQLLGPPGCNPPRNRSCQEILYCFPSALSGYHEIRVPNGSLVEVYCDMEGTNCGGQGGWMRVAHVNMSQSGASCPEELEQKELSGLRLCGMSGSGCKGTVFSTLGLSYSHVCGQLRGYQHGTPDAFEQYNANNSLKLTDYYVEGFSITYGTAVVKHIWTYANGISLQYTNPKYECPCNNGSTAQVPPYVGNDYYCETGYNELGHPSFSFFPDDPLWDGQQCVGAEAPCCTYPNMPWFSKTLSETTTEDIKLRVCYNYLTGSGSLDEETLLQLFQLFVY